MINFMVLLHVGNAKMLLTVTPEPEGTHLGITFNSGGEFDIIIAIIYAVTYKLRMATPPKQKLS